MHREIRRRYAAMIETIDAWLGRFMARIEEAGQTGNTVIFFASDHGEMLGDHGLWAKSTPHEASVRVPLTISAPQVSAAGTLCSDPASLLDIGKTILDYAGVSSAGFEGVSLRENLENEAPLPRELVFSALGEWRAVSDGRHKLTAGFKGDTTKFQLQFERFSPDSPGPIALYDLEDDPQETNNIAATSPAIRDRLLSALLEDTRRAP